MKSTLVKTFLFVGFLEVILTVVFAQESIPEFLCDGVPTNQYVRNVTDCRGWIRCKADKPISGFCPEPYFFDQQHQYCSRIENVDCYSCPDPGTLMALYSVPNNCNRYIRCLRGVATEHICDPGLQFNNDTKQCVESTVGCTSSESLECPSNLQPGEYYAIHDAANCSIGLVCVGNPEPLKIECSEILHFNKDTLMCGNPENSGCTETNTTNASTISSSSTNTNASAESPVIGKIFNLLRRF